MKKTLVALTVSLLAVGALAGMTQTPKAGQAALRVGGQLEARIHGLKERTVQVGDIAYRLYEGGDVTKPALVMLHGYSADKDVWPRFAAQFVKDYHVIVPDLAGHGETGFSPILKYDVPSQSQRVVDLMSTLGVSQFHVIGNSMGGFIAATLAANHGQHVLSAVAFDPAGVVSPQKSPMDNMIAQGRNPFEVNSRKQFDEFYTMTMAKPPYLPQFVLSGVAQDYMNRREELAAIYRDFHRQDMLDGKLGQIKAPFLLIWGKKDALLDVSAVEVWKAGVPHMQVEVYDDLGHMPMLEDPARTAERVNQFLKSL